jgi:hypothetical protein
MGIDAPREVLSALTDWKPAELPTEIDYHKSMETFLRERFPKARVEREYRHNGTTADLFVSLEKLLFKYELYVEVKRNLTKKTDYDRLVGQVAALSPRKFPVLVVLCGKTDDRYVARLNEQFKEEVTGGAFGDQSLWIMLK